MSAREILRELARKIQQIESDHRPARSSVSTGIEALDDLLPERGLKRGSLVEWLSAGPGSGAWSLAVLAAKSACGERKTLVLADVAKQFYPPAVARWGLDLNRLIVVRPQDAREAYRAVVQSLRCTGVGAALAWHDRLSMADLRRLQLAAEVGGGIGVVLRPLGARRIPSCAAVRLLVSPVGRSVDGRATARRGLPLSVVSRAGRDSTSEFRSSARRVRIDVIRCRGGKSGQTLILEIDDETGHVRLPTRMASAATVARSARASG